MARPWSSPGYGSWGRSPPPVSLDDSRASNQPPESSRCAKAAAHIYGMSSEALPLKGDREYHRLFMCRMVFDLQEVPRSMIPHLALIFERMVEPDPEIVRQLLGLIV